MKLPRSLRTSAAVMTLLGVAGCFPDVVTRTPKVSGRVVDAHSHQPVVAATVQFSTADRTVVQTGADGGFSLPPVRYLGLAVVGTNSGLLSLVVRAPNYGTTTFFFQRVTLSH